MTDMLKAINSHMHEGICPTAGSIGECAALHESRPGHWWAALYIWDKSFNDDTAVAQWFYRLGATEVLVSHVLHDSNNDVRNGLCAEDSARPWHVEFHIPQPEPEPQKYDDTLLPFLAMMRNELHANAGKGDRPGWLQMSPNECLLEIYYHVSKLQKAIRHADVALIGEHSADVANMAMMMADIVGLLPQEITEEVPA